MKPTQKNQEGLSLYPLSNTKGTSRHLASSPLVVTVQGIPPTRGSISSSSPTAVPKKAQRLNAFINVVCQDMNYLLPQFGGVSSLIAFKNPMPTNKYHVKRDYFTNPEFCSCTVSKGPGVLVAIFFVFLLKGFYRIRRTILGPTHLHRHVICWCGKRSSLISCLFSESI